MASKEQTFLMALAQKTIDRRLKERAADAIQKRAIALENAYADARIREKKSLTMSNKVDQYGRQISWWALDQMSPEQIRDRGLMDIDEWAKRKQVKLQKEYDGHDTLRVVKGSLTKYFLDNMYTTGVSAPKSSTKQGASQAEAIKKAMDAKGYDMPYDSLTPEERASVDTLARQHMASTTGPSGKIQKYRKGSFSPPNALRFIAGIQGAKDMNGIRDIMMEVNKNINTEQKDKLRKLKEEAASASEAEKKRITKEVEESKKNAQKKAEKSGDYSFSQKLGDTVDGFLMWMKGDDGRNSGGNVHKDVRPNRPTKKQRGTATDEMGGALGEGSGEPDKVKLNPRTEHEANIKQAWKGGQDYSGMKRDISSAWDFLFGAPDDQIETPLDDKLKGGRIQAPDPKMQRYEGGFSSPGLQQRPTGPMQQGGGGQDVYQPQPLDSDAREDGRRYSTIDKAGVLANIVQALA